MSAGPEGRVADAFVPVAEVSRPVGLRGELKLYPLIDWHDGLLGCRHLVWDDGTPCQADLARRDGDCPIVRVAGCASREAAEARVGRQVGFWRSSYLAPDFPRPAEGLPFRFLGRPVLTAAGEIVGRVAEVRRYVRQVLLVVSREDGTQTLVPAVAPILREDEGLDGPLVIDPPVGLLDQADAETDGSCD